MNILKADCQVALQSLPENSIDLTIFSPQYDDLRTYGVSDLPPMDFKTFGTRLLSRTKEGGVCVVIIGDQTKDFAKSMTSMRLAVDWVDLGWKMFETCIYARDGNPGAWWSKRFRVDHEFIFIFFKGKRPRIFNKSHIMIPSKHAGKTYSGTDRHSDGSLSKIEPKTVNPTKCRGTIWHYATSNSERNKVKSGHPATFPDKLAEDIIMCFSAEGDFVFDPFCGSGTTVVMALKNNRQALGIDFNQAYCDIATERIRLEVQKV